MDVVPSDRFKKTDLDALATQGVEAAAFPVPSEREDRVQIVVRQSVLDEIHTHGGESTAVEICGVLLGSVHSDAQGPFVVIAGSIRGEHATSQNAQVTFTAATWDHIHAELDQRGGGLRILGWYHTHPGFGIFLSSMDRFIHDNFFAMPEQVALVYDLVRQEQGLFVWRKGEPDLEGFVVEPDTRSDALLVTTLRGSAAQLTAGAGFEAEALSRLAILERRQRWHVAAIALVFVIALIWPAAFLQYFAFEQPDNSVTNQRTMLKESTAP